MSNAKKITIVITVLALSMIIVSLIINKASSSGNSHKYGVDAAQISQNSELKDTGIVFLGSSLTNGYKSDNESFVDYLEKTDNIKAFKAAENKSKIVGNSKNSYIPRMMQISTSIRPHYFFCELSPYDAKAGINIGELSDDYKIDSFDTDTLIGALEYIVCYAENTWHCPVVFYTCPYYEDKNYELMLDALNQVCNKWNLEIIDFYNDNDMAVEDEDKKALYIADDFYPTKAGYKELYTPKFEEFLIDIIR